jgi:hypothetical protein
MCRVITGRPRNQCSIWGGAQTSSEAQLASYPMVAGGSFPGVKRLGRAADNPPRASVGVKNAWSHASTPLVLHGVVINQTHGFHVHFYMT